MLLLWFGVGDVIAGDFIQIKGIMRKQKHHSILQRRVIPSGCRMIGLYFILLQDHDPKQNSKVIYN